MDELCRDDEEDFIDVTDVTNGVDNAESATTEYEENLNEIDVDESPHKSVGLQLNSSLELFVIIFLQLCTIKARLWSSNIILTWKEQINKNKIWCF